jgi:hypothetical protein
VDTNTTGAASRDWEEVSTLKVDLMYFTAARRCLAAAEEAWPAAENAVKEHQELWDKSEEILARHGGDFEKAGREIERVSQRLIDQGFVVGQSYRPVLENVAMTHLLCSAALEAHVNKRAKQKFSGRFFDDFDKLSLTGKWLFLPQILGHKTFDPGAEQFQSLERIVKWRNGLSHYKERQETWLLEKPVPGYLESLGLTIPAGEQSVKATLNLVEALAGLLKEEFDDRLWNLDGQWSYFEFDILRDGKVTPRPSMRIIDNTETV